VLTTADPVSITAYSVSTGQYFHAVLNRRIGIL
jgi:hypothetical protein